MVTLFDGFGPDNPLIISAAGLCRTFDLNQLEPLAAVADKVVIGSISLSKREGNGGICEYFDNPLYSVNASGMPNLGAAQAPTYVPGTPGGVKYSALKNDGQLIVSLVEFSLLGYITLFRLLRHWGSGVELNFGCPNVWDDGTQHPIVSFDPTGIARILGLIEAAKREGESRTFTGVKLSPYSDPGLLKEVAAAIADSETVDYVAVTNTFPNGRAYTSARKPALRTVQAGVVGGVGGEALKPISLANAAQFRDALPDNVSVVRVGGISSGEDVWQSYDVGCVGVQVHTAIAQRGLAVLGKIREQYADIIG